MRSAGEHEVAIVGGGPAGLTAAIVFGRSMVDAVLVSAERPRAAVSAASHGFLSRDGVAPLELVAAGRAELERYETVAVVEDTVVEAVPAEGGFSLTTAGGERLRSRRVVLAGGRSEPIAELGIPGLEDVYGTSVFPCPFCDGWERRGEPLAIFLAPDSPNPAFVEIVSGWSEDFVVFTNGQVPLDDDRRQMLEAGGLTVATRPIAGLTHDQGILQAVELEGGDTIPRVGGFVDTGGIETPSPLVAALADTENAYTAGDAEFGFAGVAIAAGDGYRVAKSIVKEIRLERWPSAS
jgi:thioredoxin reductase